METLNIKTIVILFYFLFSLISLSDADMCYLPDDTCSLSKKQYIDKCLQTCPNSLCDTFMSFYVEKCITKRFDNNKDIWHSIYIKSMKKQNT